MPKQLFFAEEELHDERFRALRPELVFAATGPSFLITIGGPILTMASRIVTTRASEPQLFKAWRGAKSIAIGITSQLEIYKSYYAC